MTVCVLITVMTRSGRFYCICNFVFGINTLYLSLSLLLNAKRHTMTPQVSLLTVGLNKSPNCHSFREYTTTLAQFWTVRRSHATHHINHFSVRPQRLWRRRTLWDCTVPETWF